MYMRFYTSCGANKTGKETIVLEHLVKEVNLENLTGPIIVSNTLKGPVCRM